MATVILAGANGYLGSNFLKKYSSRLDIFPIVRNPLILSTPHSFKVLDYQDLANSIQPFKELRLKNTTLVHMIGCSREDHANAIYEGNVGSTIYLLKICRQLGIHQIVFMSGYGITRNTTSVYYQTKALAETLIRSSGLKYIILRASYIVGKEDELTPQIQRDAKRGQEISIPGHGGYRIQPILINDVLEIVFRIVNRKIEKSGTYNLLGETVTLRKFITDIAFRTNSNVVFQERDLESMIRQSIFNTKAELSLSQIGILVADKVGKPTKTLFNVRVKPYSQIIKFISHDTNSD